MTRSERTRCRFCGQDARPGERRWAGSAGPVCSSCLELGLRVARRGDDTGGDGTPLLRLRAESETACQFCERSERYSFLGFRRPLTRVESPAAGAVICVDCLDRGADLINRSAQR